MNGLIVGILIAVTAYAVTFAISFRMVVSHLVALRAERKRLDAETDVLARAVFGQYVNGVQAAARHRLEHGIPAEERLAEIKQRTLKKQSRKADAPTSLPRARKATPLVVALEGGPSLRFVMGSMGAALAVVAMVRNTDLARLLAVGFGALGTTSGLASGFITDRWIRQRASRE